MGDLRGFYGGQSGSAHPMLTGPLEIRMEQHKIEGGKIARAQFYGDTATAVEALG